MLSNKSLVLFLLAAAFSVQPLIAQISPSNKPKARPEAGKPSSTSGAPKNVGSGATKLTKMNVTPEVEVHLPANFILLSDDGIAQKYPTWKKPKAVYSSPDGNADFIVTERRSDFREGDTEIMKKFYKASILNMFSDVQFLSEKEERINGRNYVVLEFLSSMQHEDPDMKMMKPIRKYTYIMYTVDEPTNKMVVLTLQAPAEQKSAWENTAPNIMSSVKVKQLSDKTVERAPRKRGEQPIKPAPTQKQPDRSLKQGN